MASPTQKDCDALLQKLATMERVIDGLFSSTVGARFIEPKLATLEELASEIPFNEAELRALWNSKVVELWKKYALREGEGDEDGAVSCVVSWFVGVQVSFLILSLPLHQAVVSISSLAMFTEHFSPLFTRPTEHRLPAARAHFSRGTGVIICRGQSLTYFS